MRPGGVMDLGGSVSCADLATVLDAAAGLTGATPREDAVQLLFAALARVVGFDLALCLWVDALGAIANPEETAYLGLPVPERPCAHLAHLPRSGPPPGGDFDEGNRVVARLLRPHVEDAFRRAARGVPVLTPREKEVLLLVRDGLGNAAIARALGVAEATVVKHLEHVYARIGAHSRTQALRLCGTALD